MTATEIRRRVNWQDLRKLTGWETFIENNITLPWLAASLLCAYFECYLIALPFSFIFFITALRQVHNAFHKALGTNRFLTWFSMYSNSVLMMVSVHSVKFNHLRHHKYCLTEKDYEARPVTMRWYQAILYGPIHIYQTHRVTFLFGSKFHKKMLFLELLTISAFIAIAFYFQIKLMIYHIIVMIIGEFFTAFFAVWTVHHDAEDMPEHCRTQRSVWKNKITFNMFYHLEHHLFPAVPTIKLPELAKRIDREFPSFRKKQTF
jgi:fatty acid desaturase